MANFSDKVQQYRSFDPTGVMPVEKIIEGLGWNYYDSYTFKYFISELSDDEIAILDQVQDEIDLEVIKAICLLEHDMRLLILRSLKRILEAASPFIEIDKCLAEAKGRDPLEQVKSNYWSCVGEYLQQRNIDHPPFKKNAVGFIYSVGFKGYVNLSPKQKSWLKDLILSDRQRSPTDRFFDNEHVVNKGFASDCTIINRLQ